jgi:hypothetical protein
MLFLCAAVPAHAQLMVLTPTGQVRDGLPVLRRHPDSSAVEATLTRGFSGRLLRLYALEQEFLRLKTGRRPEPAYLVLSDRRGGFPRVGFYLGEENRAGVAWVDLHRSSRLDGQFGTMDQIFPHELLHVIVRQLAGEPRRSGSNQMHAIGVRTDAVNAFSEGFAEHAQILAIDDPDATAGTGKLARDLAARDRADAAAAAYVHHLSRDWWPIQPARLRFLLWFSQTEQVQRYFAVKANLFARQPAIPSGLLAGDDKYLAYLVQNLVPGPPDGAPKPAGVLLSTEGTVSHLFWRLMSDERLQRRYLDGPFYSAFGTTQSAVSPLENVYLKLFAALHEGKPSTTVETLRAWARVCPDDRADIDRIVRDALLGQPLPEASEIWLRNDALVTGTSLFDQYRGLPRPHTFDANASTMIDWLSVPGVTPEGAARLAAGAAPYAHIDALLESPALPAAARTRIQSMAAAMAVPRRYASDQEESLDLWAIVWPYLRRLIAIVLFATVIGAALAWRAGVRRWWTAALIALVCTLLVIAFAWIISSPAWYRAAAPIVIGGLPWALWRVARGRGIRPAGRAIAAWALAALPALILVL